MLSKLLKHEFRATGRILLPFYGVLAVLALLANLSMRFMDTTDSNLLIVFFVLILITFVVGIIAAVVVTAVMMVLRFHRNLLKDEGYLMHTLPVTVHAQLWSKLIAALVWFAATGLVVFLVLSLTALIQSGTNLGELFAAVPSWADLQEFLAREGVQPGTLTRLLLEFLGNVVAASLVTCLHFYAAMSLGHMFPKDKILLSVVFFVGISFVFRMLGAAAGYTFASREAGRPWIPDFATAQEAFAFMHWFLLRRSLVWQLVQGVLLYLATVLGLKKGLNLN